MKKLFIPFFFIFFIATAISSQAQNMTTEAYINKYKYIAIKEMFDFKIPASITLAQGILESGSGNSRLAIEANNHFGIKCHNDWTGAKIYKDDDEKNECFRVYSTAEQSFRDHSLFLTTKNRYAFLFDYKITNYKSWAKGLKKAGYATNPKYPKRLIGIIEDHNLNQFDHISKKEFKKMLAENHIIISDSIVFDKSDSLSIITIDSVANPEQVFLPNPERKILYNNRIKYIIAKKGDHIDKLKEELDMFEWEFYKYNDLEKGTDIVPGQRVYLQPKRRRGSVKSMVAKKGQTMWDISQIYGIKLSWLYRRNQMRPGTQPTEGQTIILRGRLNGKGLFWK